MKLESEKRYYVGWAFAFLAIAVGIALQSSYNDLSLSFGTFVLLVGIGLVIVAFIPKYEPLTLGSGAFFAATGVLILLSRYSGGNLWNGVAIVMAIIGIILLFIGSKKEW